MCHELPNASIYSVNSNNVLQVMLSLRKLKTAPHIIMLKFTKITMKSSITLTHLTEIAF